MTKSNAKPKDKSASKQKKSTSKGDFAVTKSKPVAAAESADFTATAARERSGSSSGDSGTPAAAKDPAEPLVDPPAASIATKDSASSVTDLTDDTGDSAAPASSTTTAITATSTASKGKKKMTFDEWKESQKTADVRYKHYLGYRHEPEVESAEVDPEPGSKKFFLTIRCWGKLLVTRNSVTPLGVSQPSLSRQLNSLGAKIPTLDPLMLRLLLNFAI